MVACLELQELIATLGGGRLSPRIETTHISQNNSFKKKVSAWVGVAFFVLACGSYYKTKKELKTHIVMETWEGQPYFFLLVSVTAPEENEVVKRKHPELDSLVAEGLPSLENPVLVCGVSGQHLGVVVSQLCSIYDGEESTLYNRLCTMWEISRWQNTRWHRCLPDFIRRDSCYRQYMCNVMVPLLLHDMIPSLMHSLSKSLKPGPRQSTVLVTKDGVTEYWSQVERLCQHYLQVDDDSLPAEMLCPPFMSADEYNLAKHTVYMYTRSVAVVSLCDIMSLQRESFRSTTARAQMLASLCGLTQVNLQEDYNSRDAVTKTLRCDHKFGASSLPCKVFLSRLQSSPLARTLLGSISKQPNTHAPTVTI